MDTAEKLELFARRAAGDEALKSRLLKTRESRTPLRSFCELARENGIELWEMDVIEAGETLYAAMKRSTNGGGENSPVLEGEDDLFELFFAELK